jgi:hypothetical protein
MFAIGSINEQIDKQQAATQQTYNHALNRILPSDVSGG